MTQQQLAEWLSVTQATVSAWESRGLDRSGIAPLRFGIEALGGTVEVSAGFGKGRMLLFGGDD